MASFAQGRVFFADGVADALLAYLIKSYNEATEAPLGRTILQKLSYFAKASGVPLPFRFEIYHYGPFSQEIFYRTEDLLLDGVIVDRSGDRGRSDFVSGPRLELFLDHFSRAISPYKANLERIVRMFSRLDPSQMELVSTIHYMHSSHREWFKNRPNKHAVITSVLQVKGGKFSEEAIEGAYQALSEAGLLS